MVVKIIKKILRVVIGLVLVAVVLLAAFIAVATFTEYNPDDEESIEIDSGATESISTGDTIKILSWNIGYGALGEDADFFMDGGSGVRADSETEVLTNMAGIADTLNTIDADINILQEVDINSDRSFNVDELSFLKENLSGSFDSLFAYNYKSLYVPYPIPTIGHVECGIVTISDLKIDSATRVSLPCPFSWPIRLFNLKRCLEISRIPVDGTDSELVIINAHLEAYDDGEGKIAQTKMLCEIIQEEIDAGNYVIAGGDFNQTFSNIDTSKYPTLDGMWEPGIIDVADFDDSLTFLMDEDIASCRSLDQSYADAASTDSEDFQYYIIDGFIVSSNLEINDFECLDLSYEYADHNPILMSVTIK